MFDARRDSLARVQVDIKIDEPFSGQKPSSEGSPKHLLMAAPKPTAATAKEFIECSVCETVYTEETLYKCTKLHCPKHGNIYCEDCGRSSHKKLKKDHTFDINASYIETVAFKGTLESMKVL